MTPIIRELPADKLLLAGAHSPNGKMCVMEAAAWMAGEAWSDRPKCVCPTIGAFMRSWNDSLPDDETRGGLLKPLLPLIIDTAHGPDVATARSFMAIDWLARTLAPALLDLTPSLTTHAMTLRALAPIVDLKAARIAEPTLAAAGDAAWAAAGAKLQPVVEAMQASAQDLVRRMCALVPDRKEAAK